jgi:hypothetical protein
MRLIFLALVLSSPVSQIGAQTLVANEGGSQLYLLDSAASKQGETFVASTITNFEKPLLRKSGGMHFTKHSMRSEVALDCKGLRYQVVDSIWHDEQMARGPGHRFGPNSPQWFGPDWKHYSKSMFVQLFPLVCRGTGTAPAK